MPKETPLDILIGLTQDRVGHAGRALADLNQQRHDAQTQLSALNGYRSDYMQQLQKAIAGGVSASNYHNFRQFIATLDEAISQQNRIIAQIDTRLEAGRQHWCAEKRRLSSYETLKTRQVHQQQAREQRREQRASDEFSAGLYRRTHSTH